MLNTDPIWVRRLFLKNYIMADLCVCVAGLHHGGRPGEQVLGQGAQGGRAAQRGQQVIFILTPVSRNRPKLATSDGCGSEKLPNSQHGNGQ